MTENEFKNITEKLQDQPYSVKQRITLYIVWLLIVWGVCFTIGFVNYVNVQHEIELQKIQYGLNKFEVKKVRRK